MKNALSIKTKFGWISICERNNKLLSLSFSKFKNKGKSAKLINYEKKIQKFFSKKTKSLNFKFLLQGTDLQIKIWKEIKNIPYGQTKSYGEIAKIVRTSPRYVGNVCAQNKLLLIIPCHRVIRKDGKLGGFSALRGIELKKKLLEFESK